MRYARIFGIGSGAGMVLLSVHIYLTASQQLPSGRPIPHLGDVAVAAIQEIGRNESFYDFAGLADYDHGTRKLFLNSNRAIIAYKTARAALNNARYTPTASERLDVVQIECGDSDLRHMFECSRVRVTRLDQSEIRPLVYSSEPNAYSNPSGDRWTMREVEAAYSAEDLSDGFRIEYASPDGMEWTFEVSSAAAQERLLLKLPNEGPGPVI